MTAFAAGAATDKGRVRNDNQDGALVAPGLAAVADGMGGHQGGGFASSLALETLQRNAGRGDVPSLVAAVETANRDIHQVSLEREDLRGMGTTLCAVGMLTSSGERARVAVLNVGDSRVYLYRGERLHQLTEDHNLVQTLVREGRITQEEAATHPQRNIITRALGIEPSVEVDHAEMDVAVGDMFLLCSDGLINEVDEDRIASVLRRLADPSEAAAELVSLANAHGGRDNITVVVVHVVDSGGVASLELLTSEREATSPARPSGASPSGASAAPPGPTDETGAMPMAFGEPDGVDVLAGRPRRFSVRVLAFLVALVGLGAVGYWSISWFANNSYFVGTDAGEVVIYRGRPDGVLWFDPSVEERTELAVDDLTPDDLDRVEGNPTASSLEDAQRIVENIQLAIAEREAASEETAGAGSGGDGPGATDDPADDDTDDPTTGDDDDDPIGDDEPGVTTTVDGVATTGG
ncbi:MAG: Stp1/IreP family PP2C-type Ser/Thr phosphatase [Actinomycetota bacterium]|nr:Stp1/IreP family PP2C-type Ser/Thr phosphatase [Actinomycetota bacterium]